MNTRVMVNTDISANRLTYLEKMKLEHNQLKFQIRVISLINYVHFYIKPSKCVTTVEYLLLCDIGDDSSLKISNAKLTSITFAI